jgi:DNA-directed RNA polymerase subunit beta'
MDSELGLFSKPKNPSQYSALKISLASPELIRSWSHGEVKKPETINYRTFKPEREGLFCAKIFGPVKDYECNCGKYKRLKHRGVVCEKCGVEVISSQVRRERMGHIELAAPVAHIWFLRSLPSRIGAVLDMTLRELEKVLYFESYVVIDPGDAPLKKGELVSEEKYLKLRSEHGEGFIVGMGGEAIRTLLKKIDLEKLSEFLRSEMKATSSDAKKKKMAKRLKVVNAFINSGNRPEWMILEVIPVIPPDLRPLVPLDGGRFAASDLNDLYRRVCNRNNRLKRLQELDAPEIIIRNEKRMLQEAVDVLFDNGRRGKIVTGRNKRPLKSLSDMLKGKQGRFRQNLLGKRVDYSGRSVIVIGPELRLHQCGLPKKMALELFKPFVYHQLIAQGYVTNIKSAKKMVEKETPEVWDILEGVVYEYPIMLNRAPTLHRLGIQAFEPILIEGKAIQIHPLVCSAFNADFDGDQMAVHVPLSVEAQIEARVLMMSTNNILSPANGKPIIVPTQDIVLGLYYLTRQQETGKGETKDKVYENRFKIREDYEKGILSLKDRVKIRELGLIPGSPNDLPGEVKNSLEDKSISLTVAQVLHKKSFFSSSAEVRIAYDQGEVKVHDEIKVVIKGEKFDTTVGRIILSEIIPEGIPFEVINRVMNKKELANLIDHCYRICGNKQTVIISDRLKDLGYKYATQAGISISISDMIIPKRKNALITEAEREVEEIKQQHKNGLITDGERYNKVVDIWAHVTEKVAQEMQQELTLDAKRGGVLNSIFMMADSGARGSAQQIRQLAGMRGLMAKPSGEIIETPITANFREGLNVLQYFISTHGARKGLADTALKTANSGYLTRRLVDVSHDVIVSEDDCGTFDGIYVTPLMEGGEVVEPIGDRILGRVTLDDIKDPYTGDIIVHANQEIDENLTKKIEEVGIERVKIRSVLTCRSKAGICSLCYGRDLSTGKIAHIGEAVGVIAAQSIGEPGTQLTMRTFHIGGTASRRAEQTTLESKISGEVKFSALKTVRGGDGKLVVMNRNSQIFIEGDGRREPHSIIYGAKLNVENGKPIEPGTQIAEWDPYNIPILTDIPGQVRFHDIIEGVTMKETVDPVSQKATKGIVESKGQDLQPQIIVTPPEITFTGSFAKGLLHIRDEFVDPEGEIATDLEKLPKEVDFSEKLGKKFSYNAEEKLLILKGAFNEKEFETLISLSAERDYQKAITILFARGRDWVESIVGYSQNELLTNPKLFFQCIYTEDVEKVLSFMSNPSMRQIDFRFLQREGQVIDFSLGISEIDQTLDEMPEDLRFFPERFQEKLSYDEQRRMLKLRGVLTEEELADITSLTADSAFKKALKELSQKEPRWSLKAKERYMFIPVGANILEVSRMKVEECTIDRKIRKIYSNIPGKSFGGVLKTEERVIEGDLIAKIPRETTKTKDITGGLPRVAELFEARKPKEVALISEIDGVVSFGKEVKGKRRVIVTPDVGDPREYLVPKGKHISIHNGDKIKAGELLMDGSPNPADILNVKGEQELAKYLVDEVQEVYRLQGVKINDKHIEIIVRQMLKRIKIKDEVGETSFLVGEQVSKAKFEEENERVVREGGQPAHGEPLLLGITKASLNTDSFISAASFQETTRVLTQAAIEGKVDTLVGLKENAIMGRLIPAGTGMKRYQHVDITCNEEQKTLEKPKEEEFIIEENVDAYY